MSTQPWRIVTEDDSEEEQEDYPDYGPSDDLYRVEGKDDFSESETDSGSDSESDSDDDEEATRKEMEAAAETGRVEAFEKEVDVYTEKLFNTPLLLAAQEKIEKKYPVQYETLFQEDETFQSIFAVRYQNIHFKLDRSVWIPLFEATYSNVLSDELVAHLRKLLDKREPWNFLLPSIRKTNPVYTFYSSSEYIDTIRGPGKKKLKKNLHYMRFIIECEEMMRLHTTFFITNLTRQLTNDYPPPTTPKETLQLLKTLHPELRLHS